MSFHSKSAMFYELKYGKASKAEVKETNLTTQMVKTNKGNAQEVYIMEK